MSAELPALIGLLAAVLAGPGPASRLREVLAEPTRPGGSAEPARPGGSAEPARPGGSARPGRSAEPARPRPARTDRPATRAGSGRRRLESMSAAVDVPLALALELRAGRELGPALEAVSLEQHGFPELAARLRHSAVVAASGGDVGAALTGSSPPGRDPVSASLLVTAACCGSAVSAGLPLADLLDAAGSAARAGVSLRGMARAELAGARSTAVVLAGLPLVGLAMGQALGARPAAVLVGTGWGAGCLLAASALTVAGLLWTRAITAGLRQALP
jgi:tight adherence protein B